MGTHVRHVKFNAFCAQLTPKLNMFLTKVLALSAYDDVYDIQLEWGSNALRFNLCATNYDAFFIFLNSVRPVDENEDGVVRITWAGMQTEVVKNTVNYTALMILVQALMAEELNDICHFS